jgi:ribosomal protein S18 acetylase RimI-like enzyme
MNRCFKNYKEQDKPYIWQIYVNAMKLHISKIWGWDLGWQRKDFDKNLAEYNTCLVKFQEKTIGNIQYKIETQRSYINMLIIEPKYQSQGLGAKVISKIKTFNPEKPLELRCFKINQSAFAFYQSLGFEVIDSDDCFYSLRFA